MANYVKLFWDKYLNLETKLYFLGIFLISALGFLYIFLNYFFFHFTGVFYIPQIWVLIAPIVLAILIFALCTEHLAPRIGFFTKTYTIYFFIFLAMSIFSTGIQYTPFPLIDKYLVILDQWMGFYTLPVLNWTYSHPWLQQFFLYCYASLGIQLIFMPLLAALLMDKEAIRIYFFALIIALLIGMNFYYFFPTAGPTLIFHSPHFLNIQHDTYLKFFQVHHRLLLTTTQGGMVAFPSFHVVWAFFLAMLFRKHKWIFIPALFLNIGVILATVFLGWHYLTDLIGGILLALLSTYLAKKLILFYDL